MSLVHETSSLRQRRLRWPGHVRRMGYGRLPDPAYPRSSSGELKSRHALVSTAQELLDSVNSTLDRANLEQGAGRKTPPDTVMSLLTSKPTLAFWNVPRKISVGRA